MAGLEFCSKHNMVAYLEKTDGNTEFHQIMDFLTRSSIYYALTVSPIVSTSFVEQFWTTAKSRTVNNTSYIDATVAGKPGKNFSRKVTPLFDSILVQQTEDEGEASERPSDSQPIPSPPHPSEDQPQTQTDPSPRPSPSIAIPDSNPEGSGGNHGGQSQRKLRNKALKAQVKKLKKGVKPLITHHKAWIKSVALKTRLARKTSLKKKVQKQYVSTQGRKSVKSFKGEPSVHKDPAFDDLDDIVDDAMDYMESEDAQDEGRTSFVVLEEKESADKEVSTEAPVSTVKPNEGKRKKGVEIRNVEDTERPRPTSTRSILTLRPLPKIDPKDKGKKRIERRKVQEEWEAEEEKKRLDEEEATKAALSNEYDFIQARLNADKILAEKLQEEERERCKKHSDLKTKSFDEIQVLYEKIKRSDDSFIAIGSAEDEKMIKEMNEQAVDASKKRVKKDDSVKGEIKEEEGTRKRKVWQKEDKEVDYEILDKKYPIIEWRSEYLTTKPQYDETEEVEDVYLNVVIRKDKYPLKKEVLSQLIELKLETEEDSTMALELIRFVKKLIIELEPKDSDGNEEDS
ncbi:hypothetical protein Tco_1124849 [Tanacetum coccineum]|uniref:Uncharacterized protein n=1 Tax=Tanacetum coccineum TaxID=301880 RepID=A0ABQ5J7P3_9ASTR